MNITINISDNFISIILSIFGLVASALITYYMGRYYIEKQKQEAKQAEKMMQEQEQNSENWPNE